MLMERLNLTRIALMAEEALLAFMAIVEEL